MIWKKKEITFFNYWKLETLQANVLTPKEISIWHMKKKMSTMNLKLFPKLFIMKKFKHTEQLKE